MAITFKEAEEEFRKDARRIFTEEVIKAFGGGRRHTDKQQAQPATASGRCRDIEDQGPTK